MAVYSKASPDYKQLKYQRSTSLPFSEGNPPITGGLTLRTNTAETISAWWRQCIQRWATGAIFEGTHSESLPCFINKPSEITRHSFTHMSLNTEKWNSNEFIVFVKRPLWPVPSLGWMIRGFNKGILIVMFMGPIWGPAGADRPQVGPMLAPWTLLPGYS